MKINAFHQFFQTLRDLPIRRKLLFAFFILIFTPLGLLTFISYRNVATVYEEQVHFTARKSFDQAFTFLNYNFNTIINSSDMIYFDQDVQEILKGTYEENCTIVKQNRDMILFEQLLYNLKNYGGIYRATLYVPGWFTYANQGINFSNLTAFMQTEIYRTLTESKDKVTWFPPHNIKSDNNKDEISVISFYRKIKDLNQLKDNLGVLRISIPEQEITNILSKANMAKGGVVYLQDRSGNIITASNKEALAALNLDTAKISPLSTDDADWKKLTLNQKDFLVISETMENAPWTMVAAIPSSEIFTQSNHIRNLMLLLTIVLGGCCYSLAYLFSRSTVNRLILLNGKMEEVQRGNLNVAVNSSSKDEIGKLMESFNVMIYRTRVLVEQESQNSKAIKNYELKAL
ncbi:MAG: cache and HAMP domain-containing protein, partial [Oscillospiraceae bacterium]